MADGDFFQIAGSFASHADTGDVHLRIGHRSANGRERKRGEKSRGGAKELAAGLSGHGNHRGDCKTGGIGLHTQTCDGNVPSVSESPGPLMQSPLEIRRATISDLPDILRLVRGLARYEKLEDSFTATADDFRTALFGPTPRAEIWLGCARGTAVGYVTIFPTFSTFLGKAGLFLEDLFVEEHCRGLGYGSQLFLFVARLARERGCGRLEWTALDWNEPALKFYAARGAKLLDDWRMLRLDTADLKPLLRLRHKVDRHKTGRPAGVVDVNHLAERTSLAMDRLMGLPSPLPREHATAISDAGGWRSWSHSCRRPFLQSFTAQLQFHRDGPDRAGRHRTCRGGPGGGRELCRQHFVGGE